MPPPPFEHAILPGLGFLDQLSGLTVAEANAILRPHGYVLVAGDRPIPSGWPRSLFRKHSERVLLYDKRWHALVMTEWYEKLAVRGWRRFYGFAVHKKLRPNESVSAFIYQRRRHRNQQLAEYVPVVFVALKNGRIVRARKTWCLRVRRSKTGPDPRWKRTKTR